MKLINTNTSFIHDFSLKITIPVKLLSGGFERLKSFPVDVLDEKNNIFDQSKIINYFLQLNIEENMKNPEDFLKNKLFEFFSFNKLKLKEKTKEINKEFLIENQFINLDYHTLMNKVVSQFSNDFLIYNQLQIGSFYYFNNGYIFYTGTEFSFNIKDDGRIHLPQNKLFYDITNYINLSLK